MAIVPGGDGSTFIDEVYSAALGDLDWSRPLMHLQAATGARFTALMSLEPGSTAPAVRDVASDDPSAMASLASGYVREFHLYDPTPGYVANWSSGRWFLDAEVITPQARSRDIYYQEFLRPHGAGNWAGLFLDRGGARSNFLSFVGADGRPITDLQQRKVDEMAPHFTRALQIADRFAHLEHRGALAIAMLDNLDAPLFLLDESGRLLLENTAGRQLRASHPQALNFSGGYFRPLVPGWHGAQWARARAQGVLALKRHDGSPLPLVLSPVPAHASLAREWQRPLVLMSAAASPSPQARAQRLRVIYALTTAEAQLAVNLACEGLSPDECARLRGVAISTVRSQIKSIQAKLGLSRMSLIVRLVLSL